MRNQSRGFTIVELLIVTIVIAILATISTIAYVGIQAKARDTIRYHNVKDVMELLELYKIKNGTYPSSGYVSSDASGCTVNDAWSYSWANSNGTWLKPLIDSGITDVVPTPPSDNCQHYIRYVYHQHVYDNCPDYPYNAYIIQVIGAEGVFIPKDTVTGGNIGTWKLCPDAETEWWIDGNTWVFFKDDD